MLTLEQLTEWIAANPQQAGTPRYNRVSEAIRKLAADPAAGVSAPVASQQPSAPQGGTLGLYELEQWLAANPDQEGTPRYDRVLAAIDKLSRPQYGPLEKFTRGVSRGTSRLKSTFGDVIPAMVGTAIGADEYAQRQMEEAALNEETIQRYNPPQYRSRADVTGPLSALGYATETIGEQVPNMAAMVIPSMGGAGLAARGAATAANVAARATMGSAIGAGLGSYALNAPEVFQNIYEETGELAPGAAMLFGSAAAALDSVLPATLARQLSGPVKASVVEKLLERSGMQRGLIRSATSGLIKGAATEAPTEAAQEAISIAAERFIADNEDVFGSEEWDRIIESAIRGGIAGGAFGGAGRSVEVAREGQQRANKLAQLKEARALRDAISKKQAVPKQRTLFGLSAVPAGTSAEGVARVRAGLNEPETPAPGANRAAAIRKTLEKFPLVTEQQATDYASSRKLLAIPTDRELNDPEKAALGALQAGLSEQALIQRAAAEAQRQNVPFDANKVSLDQLTAEEMDIVGVTASALAASAPKRVAAATKKGVVAEQLDMFGLPVEGKTKGSKATSKKPAAAPVPEAPVSQQPLTKLPATREELVTWGKSRGFSGGLGLFGLNGPLVGRDVTDPAVRAQIVEDLRQQKYSEGSKNAIARDALIAELEAMGAQPAAPQVSQTETKVETPAPAVTPTPTETKAETPAPTATPAVAETKVETPASTVTPAVAETKAETPTKVKPKGKRNFMAALYKETLAGNRDVNQTRFFETASGPVSVEISPWRNGFMLSNITGMGQTTTVTDPKTGETTRTKTPTSMADELSVVQRLLALSEEHGAPLKLSAKAEARVRALLETAEKPAEQQTEQQTEAPAAPSKKPAAKGPIIERAVPVNVPADALNKLRSVKTRSKPKKGEPPLTDEEAAASYFKKYDPASAIRAMAAESFGRYVEPQTVPTHNEEDATKAVLWVKSNMPQEVVDVLNTQRDEFSAVVEDVKLGEKKQQQREAIDKSEAEQKRAKEYEFQDKKSFKRLSKAVTAAYKKMFPNGKNEIKYGTGIAGLDKNVLQEMNAVAEANIAALNNDFASPIVSVGPGKVDVVKTAEILSALDAQVQARMERTTPESKAAELDKLKRDKEKRDREKRGQSGKLLLPTPVYDGAPLSGSVVEALQLGDLNGALDILIADFSRSPEIVQVLRKIRRMNLKTKVIIGQFSVGAGYYSPRYDVIALDSELGMNEHTFMHELVHAAIAQALNDPKLTVTQNLTDLYASVYSQLGDAYGATNLQEFAAELLSNPRFQALLKQTKAPKSGNLLERAWAYIAEFFGFKKGQSAYEQGIKFISDILDVAADVEPTLFETMFLGANGVQMFGQAMKAVPKLTKNKLTRAIETRGDKAITGLELLYKGLHLNNLESLFGDKLPIKDLELVLEKKRGYLDSGIDSVSKTLRKMERITRETDEATMARMSKMAHDARRAKVDILNPKFKPTAKNAAEYARLKGIYNSLPKDVRWIYETIRKDLDKSLSDFNTHLKKLMPASMASRIDDMFANLEGVIGYVPFMRYGDYWLRYTDPKTNEDVPLAYESKDDRDRMLANLSKLGIKAETYNIIGELEVPSDLPSASFVGEIVAAMRSNKVPEATVKEVYNLWVNMFPEQSLRRQFKTAKLLKGEDSDVVRAYSNVQIKWLHRLANTQYNGEITSKLQAIKDASSTHATDNHIIAATKAIFDRSEMYQNPTFSPLVNKATVTSYLVYILGSVASAVVNITALPFMVLPVLAARFGYSNALSAFNRHGMKGLSFAIHENWGVGKYKQLYDTLNERGLLKHTVAREALERGKVSGKDYTSVAMRIMELLSTPFAASERYIRALTAVAAYDLALQGNPSMNQAPMTEQEAIEFAAKTVKDTHTTGAVESGPAYMKHPVGRVALMFKNIIWQQAFLVANAFAAGYVKSNLTEQQKRIARRQFLGMYGLAFAFLGAKGVPFFGAATFIANTLAALIPDDDDEPFDSKTWMRTATGSLFYNGLLNEALGIEVSSRAALANDILWRDDPQSIEDHGFLRTVFWNLAGPLGGYALGAENAINDFNNGQTLRGLEGILPTFAKNGLRAYRFQYEEGVRTRNGDLISEDVNAWNTAMQAIGFTPADLSDRYNLRAMAKNYEKKVLARKQDILNRHNTAKMNRDYRAQRQAEQDMKEFRKKYPQLVDSRTLERSWDAFRSARENSVYGLQISTRMRNTIEEKFFE